MIRSLARVYYYFVFDAMLVLAAVGLGLLLNQALRYTSLNSDGSLPSASAMTQAVSFAVVFWLIAGVLGGVHYFLIRRDQRLDPGAGSGGARSFFLNLAEFVAGWVGLNFAVGGLNLIGTPRPPGEPPELTFSPPVVPYLAVAAAAYFIVLVAEVERRRTRAARGAPVVFQRLHFYAIQFIVLIYAMVLLVDALNATLQATLFSETFTRCVTEGPVGQRFCPQVNLLGPWLASAFAVVLFGIYWLLARRDTGSALRQTQQLLGLAVGALATVGGVFALLSLGVSLLLGASETGDAVARQLTSALPLVAVGLLAASVYGLWLRLERGDSRMGAEATDLSIGSVAAAAAAISFWIGIFMVVLRLAEILTNASYQADTPGWAGPAAAVLAGLPYIAISLYVRVVTGRTGVNGPRRAFVLALLAAGVLVGAIGGGIALVTTLTASLGSPLDASGESTRVGTSMFLTGLALVVLYGWSVVSERLVGGPVTTGLPAGGPLPASPGLSVETILDELLAGRLTREAAAAQVREAVRAGR